MDPRYIKFPHLSHSHLSITQLDSALLSQKVELEGLLQKPRVESATQESDSTDVQITGTSDSDKPSLKKQKKTSLTKGTG